MVWPWDKCSVVQPSHTVTRNAQNEHTIQKKPVILPDLSFLEMLLSNQTSPCKRGLQLQSDKLMSPVPPRKKKTDKVSRKELGQNNLAHQKLVQEFSNISATFFTHCIIIIITTLLSFLSISWESHDRTESIGLLCGLYNLANKKFGIQCAPFQTVTSNIYHL